MQRGRAAFSAVTLIVAAVASSPGCRSENLPVWSPPPIEARQNPLLVPVDGMADVTKLCSPPPCANGTALRNAINDALWVQNKRALYFPPGEHTIPSAIQLPPNSTIAGLGATSIIRRTGSGDGSIFHLDGVSHVTISNLTIVTHKPGEPAYAKPAIHITSTTGAVLTNIRIINNLFICDDPGHSTAYYATAIFADGTTKLSESWITNNYTRNQRLLQTTSSDLRNLFISDNKIENSPTDGLAMYTSASPVRHENILIVNNSFGGVSETGLRMGAAEGSQVSGIMQNIKIANNSISVRGSAATRGILLIKFAGTATEPRPNRNISITGNTIWRKEGETTSLTAIVVDRAVGPTPWGDNVLISGNTVRDEKDGMISRGIQASFLRNSVISDNTIGSPDVGIILDQHEGVLIKGNNISGASATNPTLGIDLGYGSDTLITGNVITGRTGRPQGGYAALALLNAGQNSPRNTFTNILVRGNRFVGLGAGTTCAVFQEAPSVDARYYNNDLTSNSPLCGYTSTKAFVDNLVDTPSDEARLSRHFTRSASLTFNLSSATVAEGLIPQVTGAREGDSVAVGVSGLPSEASSVTFHGHVSGNDQVMVRAVRHGAAIASFSATVRVSVLQYAN